MWKQNLLPLTLFLLHLPSPTAAASITPGPLAQVSIQLETAYSTARACAAKCLIYNGRYMCGYGPYDLRLELGCDCGAVNGCYCSAGLQSSATSYLRNCVSTNCGDVQDEVTSILNLYAGYCKTANVALPAKTSAASTVAQSIDASSATDAATGSSPTAETASSSFITGTAAAATSTSAGKEKEEKESGLSKSDIIALATGVGVGLPSLMIAAIALCIQLRKRRAAAASQQHTAVSTSQIELPLVHNTGNWGNTGGVYAPGPIGYR